MYCLSALRLLQVFRCSVNVIGFQLYVLTDLLFMFVHSELTFAFQMVPQESWAELMTFNLTAVVQQVGPFC